jgi:hypothetical protein
VNLAHRNAIALREIFNRSQLWERHLRGELQLDVIYDGVPRPENKQPAGTRSITAALVKFDSQSGRRRRLAVVHFYRLPSGRINNRSGRPDPKMCIVRGVKYVLKT